MDNRVNKIRREITVLRAAMPAIEASIRDQISDDLDCTESALRLMAMRAEVATLVGQWKAAGGGERLPTIQERLKQNHRSGREAQAGTSRHWRSSLRGWPGTINGPEHGAESEHRPSPARCATAGLAD
jgi:chorismate mutase